MYELTVLFRNGKEQSFVGESFDINPLDFSLAPTPYRISYTIPEGYPNAGQEANIYLMSDEVAGMWVDPRS